MMLTKRLVLVVFIFSVTFFAFAERPKWIDTNVDTSTRIYGVSDASFTTAKNSKKAAELNSRHVLGDKAYNLFQKSVVECSATDLLVFMTENKDSFISAFAKYCIVRDQWYDVSESVAWCLTEFDVANIDVVVRSVAEEKRKSLKSKIIDIEKERDLNIDKINSIRLKHLEEYNKGMLECDKMEERNNKASIDLISQIELEIDGINSDELVRRFLEI